MKQFTTFFKKLRLSQILTAFLASSLLLVSTACSTGDVTGARPNNPPVQAGGANNPYKGGGDSYTKFNQSTNPPSNSKTTKSQQNRAELPLKSDRLMAVGHGKETLYPGAEAPAGTFENSGKRVPLITEKDFEQPQPGGLIQREPDIGSRASDRLEKVQETFKEASGFLKDKADEALARPEMKPDPAQQK